MKSDEVGKSCSFLLVRFGQPSTLPSGSWGCPGPGVRKRWGVSNRLSRGSRYQSPLSVEHPDLSRRAKAPGVWTGHHPDTSSALLHRPGDGKGGAMRGGGEGAWSLPCGCPGLPPALPSACRLGWRDGVGRWGDAASPSEVRGLLPSPGSREGSRCADFQGWSGAPMDGSPTRPADAICVEVGCRLLPAGL